MQRLFIALFSVLLLTACGTQWQVPTDLTPDEQAEKQAEIERLQHAILAFEPSDDALIPQPEIVQLGRAYEALGDLKSATQLYEGYLKQGHKSPTLYNNVARLYERVGKYDKAIEYYEKLISEFNEINYLYDIAWAYIRAGDADNAARYYELWTQQGNGPDVHTQLEIKKLRQ